jgi:NitT/TauT family transport system substrate-binding protein
MKNTNNKTRWAVAFVCTALITLNGCGGSKETTIQEGGDSKTVPTFSLAWSEYPSWSVFGVADAKGIINGKKGELGPVEKKWGVDIELKEAEYDPCLAMYGAGQCDAVCITNMDILSPATGRPGVMVLPTSTSFGADACLVTENIKSVEDLKGKKVFGLEKSVSEYCFVRNIELLGQAESDYTFANMDPGAAAVAMQQGNVEQQAIVVWNPFVMETLGKRSDVRVLFDSTQIPNEIIDSVVVAEASLKKAGGEAFACAVIEAYYEVNKAIADPAKRDDTLIAIGEKFSNLGLEQMEKVVKQTQFYGTPDEGLAVLTGTELPKIMEKVVDFCASHGIVDKAPDLGYGDAAKAPNAAVRFDPAYIHKVNERPAK